MANFCRNCGRMLLDNEICTCTTQQVQPQYTQPVQPQYTQPAQPQYTQPARQTGITGADVKAMGSSILQVVGALAKKPANAAAQFISLCNVKMALILLGVHSVSVALYVFAVLLKYNMAVDKYYGDYGYGYRFDVSAFKAPLFTGFLGSGISAFVIALALAGVLFVLAKIFRGQTSFKHMLCVSAVKGTILTPYMAAAFLLQLVIPFDPEMPVGMFVPMLIIAFGTSLGEYSLVYNIGSAKVSPDRVPYIMIINAIVMMIIMLIVMSALVPACLPQKMM